MSQAQFYEYEQQGAGDLDASDLQYLRDIKVKSGDPSKDLSPRQRAGLHAVINDPKFRGDPLLREAYAKSYADSAAAQNIACIMQGMAQGTSWHCEFAASPAPEPNMRRPAPTTPQPIKADPTDPHFTVADLLSACAKDSKAEDCSGVLDFMNSAESLMFAFGNPGVDYCPPEDVDQARKAEVEWLSKRADDGKLMSSRRDMGIAKAGSALYPCKKK